MFLKNRVKLLLNEIIEDNKMFKQTEMDENSNGKQSLKFCKPIEISDNPSEVRMIVYHINKSGLYNLTFEDYDVSYDLDSRTILNLFNPLLYEECNIEDLERALKYSCDNLITNLIDFENSIYE